MKKFWLSAFIILSFTIYALYQRRAPSTTNFALNSSVNTPLYTSNTAPTNSIPSDSSTPPPTSSPPTTSSQYKDGSFTGNSANAYYGNVQVKAIIKSGKIADVQILDYPQDRNNSININSQALPILQSEAIKAQNANVDAVSGATFTSQAFVQSLTSALDQAKMN